MLKILSQGGYDITAERLHQVAVELYDAEHDDNHDGGELAVVAAGLALAHTSCVVHGALPDPWGLKKKHQDTRRRLVIAGALIAAEIDRLDRLAAKECGA